MNPSPSDRPQPEPTQDLSQPPGPGTTHRVLAVLWPAFLAAAVLEMGVFALVDPHELHWQGQPLEWSARAVYSLTFFAFWATTAAAGGITSLLLRPSSDINRLPPPTGQ